MGDTLHPQLRRDSSPINRTELALLNRGIDSGMAASLRKGGWTLGKLKQETDENLITLGLPSEAICKIRAESRPEIPFDNLIQVLAANRFTCCVCHEPSKAVVVHHIQEWSKSHDHSPANLAVLCLEHHDRAHSVSQLSRNLDKQTLTKLKHAWEDEVCRTNTEAVLEASRLNSDAWWYFNHVRLFELAAHLRLKLNRLSKFNSALSAGLVQEDGSLKPRSNSLHYMYSGGEGMTLYSYVREVMNTVLDKLTILNISDYLDRSFLAPTVKPGDFVFIQGAHYFTSLSRAKAGRDQTQKGIRKANHVEVSYTFDRWEATSNSAWGSWLVGRQEAGSLVRVISVDKVDGMLQVKGTVLGICCALEGLKEREYAAFPYRRGVYFIDDADDFDC